MGQGKCDRFELARFILVLYLCRISVGQKVFLQIKFFVFDFQIDKMYILKLCKGMRLAFAIRKVKVSLAVN